MRQPFPYVLVFICGIALGASTLLLVPYAKDRAGEQATGNITRLKDPKAMYDDGFIEYRNARYGFSLRYPEGLVSKEFDEGNDSYTVVFQKPGEKVGFQIYITPHAADTISGETIRRDVASGVVRDLKEETILIRGGGEKIIVATFESEAPLTGKNREMWFLRNGYIYEFTSYGPEEEWLRAVLFTLAFDA